METGYSGLRRTRKRAHSSKCPCCYSSEEEQENHASAKKEKVKDRGNQNNGKRSSTRKRKVASDDDIDNKDASKETISPAESADESQNSKKPKTALSQKHKTNGKKRKTASLKQEPTNNALTSEGSEQNNKQSSKGDKAAKKKKSKTGVSTSDDKDESVEGANATKSKDTLEKKPSPQIQVKSRKSRKKNTKQEFKTDAQDIDKNEIEPKEKCLNSKKARARNIASSGNIGAQKQGSKDIGEQGKLFSDIKTSGAKTNDKQSKTRSKNGKSRDVPSGSMCEPSKEKEAISLGNNKRTKTLNPNIGDLAKRKIEVFDHLFGQLKKCPGFSKTTVSSAAKLLLQLDAEEVKSLVRGSPSKTPKTGVALNKQAGDNLPSTSAKSKTAVSLSEPKRRRTESDKSLLQSSDIKNVGCLPSSRKTTSGQAEEVKLSQAAEALVSFRANPTILRQEKTEADIPLVRSTDKDIATNNVEKKLETSPSSASNYKETHTSDKVIESLLQAVTTTNELRVPHDSESCYVNAPSQRHVTSQLPSSLLMQGALHQPVRFPASLEANLKQVAAVQRNLMNLSQFSSQINSAPAVPMPFSPRVNVSSSENPRMMNPTSVQNIQALFHQPTQPSNIQTPMPAQTPGPTLAAGGINQQLQPQQPLKGMEDVVSCVGSRSTTNLLWNIKPTTSPVVYLTSPQTLSGVRARNFIPQNEGHRPLPFTASVAKIHSVGLPKTSLTSASTSALTFGNVTLVNQAASLSTSHAANVTGQRKILPRDQRMPSLFASAPQRASQLPVTSVVGQIPRNIPPVRVGSMPVQFSGLGVTSPLNTRQPPISTVITQASVTQTPVIQVPVVHTACITTGQTTAVSSAVFTPVSAKQAVKKFVHERTKSAELKRTGSLSNLLSIEPVTSSAVGERQEIIMVSAPSSQGGQLLDQPEKQSASNNQPEFNLHQAASALLSISSQDGLNATDAVQPVGGEGDDSLDEHNDEVVFTSKGVFRVGDVDVDPQYNIIGREGYTCGKCGKIFTSLSYLARHIKRVCPDMSCRKWKCNMCDKAFRHPFGLQQHIYTHTGERPHKCSQCPKAFYSSNDLRRHSRIHSGERPYHCKHCDKSFATTISLKTHTYIHTGEKPHKCPHCPKTFATSSKLGRHIVTHSEQRPFACEHCPKSFNRSGDLRRHNIHVHESRDKPIDFDDCGTPFNRTGNVSIPTDTPKEQDSVPGQMHQCSVYDSLGDLRRHMICHATPVSLESNQIRANKEVNHLDESTESGSINSK